MPLCTTSSCSRIDPHALGPLRGAASMQRPGLWSGTHGAEQCAEACTQAHTHTHTNRERERTAHAAWTVSRIQATVQTHKRNCHGSRVRRNARKSQALNSVWKSSCDLTKMIQSNLIWSLIVVFPSKVYIGLMNQRHQLLTSVAVDPGCRSLCSVWSWLGEGQAPTGPSCRSLQKHKWRLSHLWVTSNAKGDLVLTWRSNLNSETGKKQVLVSPIGVQNTRTVGVPQRIKADLFRGGSGRAEAGLGWDLEWCVITLLLQGPVTAEN